MSDTVLRNTSLDLANSSVREVNRALKTASEGSFEVLNPGGAHALACGLDAPVDVSISGHAGYYCAGMNKHANITVEGNASTGVAENMMSGTVHVKGNVSQSAGATAHGGLLVIEGDASARCGISLKGAEIVVGGSVGHMSALWPRRARWSYAAMQAKPWATRSTKRASIYAVLSPASVPIASKKKCARNTVTSSPTSPDSSIISRSTTRIKSEGRVFLHTMKKAGLEEGTSRKPLSDSQNHIRGFFGDHDRRSVGITRYQSRHDRRINNAEAPHAIDLEVW